MGLNIRNRRFAEKATKKQKQKTIFPVTDPLSLAHPGKNTPFGRDPSLRYRGQHRVYMGADLGLKTRGNRYD